jgi:hypothetical protein
MVVWECTRRVEKRATIAPEVSIMQYEARLAKIPIELPMTVYKLETGDFPKKGRERLVSKAGAIGLMQIMPFHAKGFGYKVKDLYKPEVNIKIGCKLLGERYKKYGGDIGKVLASYNGGHGQARLRQSQRCYETYWYVKRGLKIYKELTNV